MLDFVNRSNLAAILRIESSKKKLEADILKRLEEERYQSEIKWRDSVLRRKPAWKSIKYRYLSQNCFDLINLSLLILHFHFVV